VYFLIFAMFDFFFTLFVQMMEEEREEIESGIV
jgi:hypothetical protein